MLSDATPIPAPDHDTEGRRHWLGSRSWPTSSARSNPRNICEPTTDSSTLDLSQATTLQPNRPSCGNQTRA